MFFITDKHIIFVSNTEATLNWWKPAVQRQIMTLMKSDNPMLTHDGYDEKDLMADLENKKNEEYSLHDVLSAETEEKAWGSILKLKIRVGGKEKKYHLSVVKDWVSYPIKDPVKFMKIDWSPIVDYLRKHQGR